MDWPLDKFTQEAASQFPLIMASEFSKQYEGRNSCDPTQWRDVLLQNDVFAAPPPDKCADSPDAIISDFKNGQYLQGVARTVSWGAMWRRKRYIYRCDLERIYDSIACCADSIKQTHSIRHSWELLTGQAGLQWSSVMTSKALHFLSRALGFCQNPPVPIDGAAIRQKVWPAFRNASIEGGFPREMHPNNWNGNSFDAYCRYMSVIITWAEAKNWTTTQIEATIFAISLP